MAGPATSSGGRPGYQRALAITGGQQSCTCAPDSRRLESKLLRQKIYTAVHTALRNFFMNFFPPRKNHGKNLGKNLVCFYQCLEFLGLREWRLGGGGSSLKRRGRSEGPRSSVGLPAAPQIVHSCCCWSRR